VISTIEQVHAGREISRLLQCRSLDRPLFLEAPIERQMQVDPVDELVVADIEGSLRARGRESSSLSFRYTLQA
jgi:hypothetical protein